MLFIVFFKLTKPKNHATINHGDLKMKDTYFWKLEKLSYDYGLNYLSWQSFNMGFLQGLTLAENIVRQHDSTPRISPEEDSHANANQTGYLTARDQIANAIKECRESHSTRLKD